MSTTLPNSPMMLDSTGRSIVQKLQGIIDALGGGGGGDMVMPPEYDPELEDNTKGYFRGQYVTYNDSLYKCKQFIYVTEGTPAGPFDDTKWDEWTQLPQEAIATPKAEAQMPEVLLETADATLKVITLRPLAIVHIPKAMLL